MCSNTINLMKNNWQILYSFCRRLLLWGKNKQTKLLLSIICMVAATLFWGGAVYYSSLQGQADMRETAIQSLRDIAELEVNRSIEETRIPYSKFFSKKKHTKRIVITEKGKFEVSIDSVKEAQGLYSLEVMGSKVEILNSFGGFPLKRIYDNWKERMKETRYDIPMALLMEQTPLGSNVVQRLSCGDSAVFVSGNELGSYYLDGAYTMVLTAYLLPDFWECIDWNSPWVILVTGAWLILMISVLLKIRASKLQREEHKSDTLIENSYQIGEYVFDIVNYTLTYKDVVKPCSLQLGKLLYAFLVAPDHILTYDEITKVCGWPDDCITLGDRRRDVIRKLRKLFDGRVEFVAHIEEKVYQMIIP